MHSHNTINSGWQMVGSIKRHLNFWYNGFNENHYQNKRDAYYCDIANNEPKNQLPKELTGIFDKLNILKHLRNAEINKNLDFTRSEERRVGKECRTQWPRK